MQLRQIGRASLRRLLHGARWRWTQGACSSLPRTDEQLQACSIGRRSLTAQVQSKEEGAILCSQAAPASAGQTGKQFASATHRRAATSLLDWSESPDGSSAKQRGRRRQPLLTSSSCECRPDRQTVCMDFAPTRSLKLARRAATSLLDLSESRDGSSAKQSKEEGGSLC